LNPLRLTGGRNYVFWIWGNDVFKRRLQLLDSFRDRCQFAGGKLRMTYEVHGINQRVPRIPEQAIRVLTWFWPHNPAKRHRELKFLKHELPVERPSTNWTALQTKTFLRIGRLQGLACPEDRTDLFPLLRGDLFPGLRSVV